MDPTLPGYNPSATVDCAGNPVPPGGGYGDTNCCGLPPPEEYVCMGGVVGQGGTNTCSAHPVGTYQMGDPNVMGIYPTQAACDAACGPQTTKCDFSWTSSCAQQHFGSLGGTQQLQSWLVLRETGFNNVGCQHLQNAVNWTTNQLNSGPPPVTAAGVPLNQTQITRKTAKRDWAICQGDECGCTLNVPPLLPQIICDPPPTGCPPGETWNGSPTCACQTSTPPPPFCTTVGTTE